MTTLKTLKDTNMCIEKICITKNKELLSLKNCNTIKGFGLENDDKGGKVLREVVIYLIPRENTPFLKAGLCTNKFKANLYVSGYKSEELKIDSKLKIGSTILTINGIGKKCYADCNLVKESLPCPLKHNVLFCSVDKAGSLAHKDKISISL